MTKVVSDEDSCGIFLGNTPCGIYRDLYGQTVHIVLERDPEVTVTGTLVRVTSCGEALLDTPEGRRVSWPVLECTPL